MNIAYSPFVRWIKPVVAEPETLYGKKNQKRIRSTLARVSEHEIEHEFRPLDEAFLEWFTPLYEETIGAKQNAAVHDLHKMTLGNTESLSEYWCLTLTQSGAYIGGTIIGVREDKIMIAYRTYQQKWNGELTLQGNPSLYTEYLASAWAYELGKDFISHGKDRNPYGMNAAIGLAIFKLSVGCKAYILEESKDYLREEIDTTTIGEDSLILHYPEHGDEILEATLLCTQETEMKYSQLTGYTEQLRVNISYRD